MTDGNPRLYTKSADEVTAEIAAKLRDAGGPNSWRVTKGEILAGSTQLFGRLDHIMISRINEMPEQHFRAFLNEAELDRLPPQPGRTEVTFLPAPDGPAIIPAPAGTQVATRSAAGQPELIFETERAITVTPAGLAACIAVDPVNYSLRTGMALGDEIGNFPAFVGDTERERILYLGDGGMFTFADDASRTHGTLSIAFAPLAAAPAANLSSQLASKDFWHLRWLFWDGKAWSDLALAGAQIVEELHWFEGCGASASPSLVRFSNLPVLKSSEVNGVTTLWLAAQLTGGTTRACLPALTNVELTQAVHVPGPCPATIDSAFAAIQGGKVYVPLDIASPIQPFGPQPGALDTFYVRVDGALSKEGALVTFQLSLPDLPEKLDDTSEIEQLKVVWEYYSDEGWTELGFSQRGCPTLEKYGFDLTDFPRPKLETNFLTRQKYLEFAVPPQYTESSLPAPFPAGRLIKDIYTGKLYVQFPVPDGCKDLDSQLLINGCYTPAADRFAFRDKTCALTTAGILQFRVPRHGEARQFAKTVVNGKEGYWVRARLAAGSYNVPRSIRRLFGQRIDLPPEIHAPVITQLTVTFADYDVVLGPRRPQFCFNRVDQRWRDLGRELTRGRTIAPFTGTVEEQALYAGFMPLDVSLGRAAFPPGAWLQLRIDVDEGEQMVDVPAVSYEYWNGKQWSELRCVDGTFGLRRTGYLGFYAPDDHKASFEFGQEVFWLRVIPAAPAGEAAPRLGSILLNTVPAVNARTLLDEVLGSSSGEKNQHFALSHAPVLPDLEVEVRERDVAGDAAHETWVKWSRVDSFYGCDSESRCYILDQAAGVVTFGDGVAGKIPPPGIENVRAARYRIHAGLTGNAAAGAVSDLRSTQGPLGNVDRVINHGACAGGADAEIISQVKRRGPQVLKHRGRAVTQEDLEWLGIETGGIERIYPLAATRPDGGPQAGWVTAVIVPRLTAEMGVRARPTPSPALLRQVRAYLEERVLTNLTAAGLTTEGLHLCGPDYVEVRVKATVVTQNAEASDEIRLAVVRQLEAFLHPLTGGPQRTGWILGRDVYVSEVAAEIESVPGVDHVATIGLSAPSLQMWKLAVEPVASRYDLPGGSQVSLLDETVKLKLAEPVIKQAQLEELAVYGFEAGAAAWLVDTNAGASPSQVRLAAVDPERFLVHFTKPIESLPVAAGLALRSLDGRIELPVKQWEYTSDDDGKQHTTGAFLQMLQAGDHVSLVHTYQRSRIQFPLIVRSVTAGEDLARIFVPARYLVCSGDHEVRMVLESKNGNSGA